MRLIPTILCLLACLSSLHAVEREVWGEYKLGILGADRASPVYAAAKAGAQDAAKAMEEKHKLDIELLFAAPSQGTAHGQTGALGEFFVQGVNGIVIDTHPGDKVSDELKFLGAQNIPAVAIHRQAEPGATFAFIGSDQEALGKAALDALANTLPARGGSVAVLAGDDRAVISKERLAGAKEAAQALGNIRPYGIFTSAENFTAAYNEVDRVTSAERDKGLHAWLFLGPWALSGSGQLPWTSDRIRCVSIGAEPPQLPYLMNGSVDALVAEKYYDWGYEAVVVLIEKLHLSQDPESATILTDGEVITKENLSAYQQKWVEWLR